MTEALRRFDLVGMLDSPVVDPVGNRVGAIRQLLVDTNAGRIEYAKLELDSEWTEIQLHVIVPWSQFRPSEDRQRLELRIGLATLYSVAAKHPIDRRGNGNGRG